MDTAFKVIIAGKTYVGNYDKVRGLRVQAIKMGVGCSGIKQNT